MGGGQADQLEAAEYVIAVDEFAEVARHLIAGIVCGLLRSRSTASLASGNWSDASRRPGPTGSPVLGRLGGRVLGGAVVEVQLDESVGIAVGRDAAERPDDDAQADLLEAFAGRGLVGGLARLALAAGEFPVAGIDGPGGATPDQERVVRGGSARCPTGIGSFAVASAHSRFSSSSFWSARPARGWPPGPWPG